MARRGKDRTGMVEQREVIHRTGTSWARDNDDVGSSTTMLNTHPKTFQRELTGLLPHRLATLRRPPIAFVHLQLRFEVLTPL